jgi:enamine deaminase RidA (YjgF/YER057c/UK114 family)
MTGEMDARLQQLGIDLPHAAAPAGNYAAAVRSGSQLFVSGQLPIADGELRHRGKLGGEVDLGTGQAAARLCALNILAQARGALGTLDRVAWVVKLVGFVNSTADFVDQPKVINGASDLMAELFGDRGQHARSAVGVASLPFGAAVEVEAIFEVAS